MRALLGSVAATVMLALGSVGLPHTGLSAGGLEGSVAPAAYAVAAEAATLHGSDVSQYQPPHVDWKAAARAGASFAYVKATEGNTYTNANFAEQYTNSAAAGLIRGAYHFAHPDASSGTRQADYFIEHGGKWSRDGKTLPGALDIEYKPGDQQHPCYGLDRAAMVKWISEFTKEYHSRAGRYPVIYTSTNWWSQCTGNYSGLARTDPLWIVNWTGTATPLPHGWSKYTFWQHARDGQLPGDQDVFSGTRNDLRALAMGS